MSKLYTVDIVRRRNFSKYMSPNSFYATNFPSTFKLFSELLNDILFFYLSLF